MKTLAIPTILAFIALQAGLSQDSKPVPLPFHKEITPVEFLEREMHSFPTVVARFYALYERDKNEKSLEEANKRLISLLRLEMKGLFSSQQRAVEFSASNAHSSRGLPKELVSEYQGRMETGWYEAMLQKTLSADEIVGLLNAERETWERARDREGVNQRESSSSPTRSNSGPIEPSAVPDGHVAKDAASPRTPLDNLGPRPEAGGAERTKDVQSPFTSPFVPVAVVVAVIAGVAMLLFKRKSP